MINGAWMLDDAMDNCVYTLSLASRYGFSFKLTLFKLGPESTLSSKSYELSRIESSRLVPELIRFHTDFKLNVRKAFRVDSFSSESILKSINLIITVSLGVRVVKRTRCLAYGNSRPSEIGQMIGPRGSTNDGHPVLVLDQSRLAMITDRVWRFIRTENPWVGDSHSVYYQSFQLQVQAWKVGEASVIYTECLAFSECQVFRCVSMEN
ncbi:hypothetical protein PIB30_036309 [Stylosanthes scabra]|uniref:Uncharacterized protein n=1 Tax=Stylosanthes scabra TaxID=79078 RepID=A0ABU6SDB4_9FABA|nr:hypothetical protein [Stylosanthes scabra]